MATETTIRTPRLILRTVTLDDVANVAAGWKLNGETISREEAQAEIRWMQANHAQNAPGELVHLCLAIIENETGAWIGWCGLDHRDRTKENPVLFYLLKESHWGKGLATEAAQALLCYAFADLALNRIDGGAASDNLASKRVMEKIHMRSIGIDAQGGHAFTLSRDEFYQLPDSPSRHRAGFTPKIRHPSPLVILRIAYDAASTVAVIERRNRRSTDRPQRSTDRHLLIAIY